MQTDIPNPARILRAGIGTGGNGRIGPIIGDLHGHRAVAEQLIFIGGKFRAQRLADQPRAEPGAIDVQIGLEFAMGTPLHRGDAMFINLHIVDGIDQPLHTHCHGLTAYDLRQFSRIKVIGVVQRRIVIGVSNQFGCQFGVHHPLLHRTGLGPGNIPSHTEQPIGQKVHVGMLGRNLEGVKIGVLGIISWIFLPVIKPDALFEGGIGFPNQRAFIEADATHGLADNREGTLANTEDTYFVRLDQRNRYAAGSVRRQHPRHIGGADPTGGSSANNQNALAHLCASYYVVKFAQERPAVLS